MREKTLAPARNRKTFNYQDPNGYTTQSGTRKPKNTAEAKCWEVMEKSGFKVTKRGWPDFFCWTSRGELAFVEVKPNSTTELKRHQKLVLSTLSKHGLPCFVYSPDVGFRRWPLAADNAGYATIRGQVQTAGAGVVKSRTFAHLTNFTPPKF